jgi:hypothetical protein
MRERLEELASTNVFPVLSLVASGYFFYCFSVAAGLPPTHSLDGSSAAYLALAILFFILPEVRRFQNTKLREAQAQLNEAKDELQELKSETRALMSAYNGLIFSVSSATNHLMSLNTLPNPQDVKEAKKSLNAALGEETGQHQLAAEIDLFLNEEDSDFESALWDLRRVMEKELRRVVRQEPVSANADGSPRFLSSATLFEEFVKQYPNYGPMYNAFHYVLRVCDAALHGRQVPENFIQEAFHMGFRILDALRHLAPEQGRKQPESAVKIPAYSATTEGLAKKTPVPQPTFMPEPMQVPNPTQATAGAPATQTAPAAQSAPAEQPAQAPNAA